MKRQFKTTSFPDFNRRFPDDQACLDHIARARFGDPPRCPKCESSPTLHSYKIPRQLFCRSCQSVISIMAGTAFANSIINARVWFYIILLMANKTTGISTNFVARHLNLTQKASFRALKAIRTHITLLTEQRRFGAYASHVQVDEAWLPWVKIPGKSSQNGAIIFGLHDFRGVQTWIIKDRRRETLLPIIRQFVEPGSIIISDYHKGYDRLSNFGFEHIRLNHSKAEWVNPEGFSMLGIEGYWSNLKYYMRSHNRNPDESSLRGYLDEHAFRYNARKQGKCVFEELIAAFPTLDR